MEGYWLFFEIWKDIKTFDTEGIELSRIGGFKI